MADYVRELIMKNIVTTLQTITVANGYQNTIASVQRYSAHGNVYKSVPAIIVAEDTENYSYDADPLTTCKLPVVMGVATRHDESDTHDTNEILNSLLGDIQKAMGVDPRRGGYAVDTQFQSADPLEIEEGIPNIGLLITVEIHYRFLNDNPATAG